LSIPPKYKGLFFSLLSSICFSGMSAMVHLSGDLPSMQKALFRNLPALFIAVVVLLRKRTPLRVARENRLPLFGRCAAGTAGLLLNFYAIDHLVLSDANMLNKLSPFFAVFFSFLLLKERLKAPQILGIISAFCGALLIIKPTGSGITLIPAIGGAISGVCAGLAYTCVRKMGQHHENGDRIVFYFCLFSCVITLPYFILKGHPMSTRQLLTLIGAGLFGAGGQFAITRAYFYAPARELSVYEYLQVLFAAAWGFFLFDQVPDWISFLGYVVIIGSAVVMFLYNNHAGPFRPKNAA
jgi:drug/metabolite transporter (DMT)-like permease